MSAAAKPSVVAVNLVVNGSRFTVSVDSRTTLLDALRDHLGFWGVKKGCDHGVCGCCTVLAGGERRLSCLSFAVMHENDEILTIEGLARADGSLHPLQTAFIEHDAFQCGYCTPGQIMSAYGLIAESGEQTPASVREGMENQCRCGCYPNIVTAVVEASRAPAATLDRS